MGSTEVNIGPLNLKKCLGLQNTLNVMHGVFGESEDILCFVGSFESISLLAAAVWEKAAM